MIGSFGKDLNNVLNRIKKSFQILDAVTASAIDLYAKANAHLRTDADRLYTVIQQCYDVCLQHLEEQGIDIMTITSVPVEYRKTAQKEMEPFWKAFQHSLKNTLTKYEKHFPKLDKEVIDDFLGAVDMTTEHLLDIFDKMLETNNE